MFVKLARLLAVPTALACLFLTGCSSADGDSPPPSSSSGEGSDIKTVTVDGLGFDVPASYREVTADDLTNAEGGDDTLADMAERFGTTQDEFLQTMRSVDLYLFSDKGPQHGFVDNINVFNQPGAVADDAEIRSSFDQLGATVEDVRHETTDAGDVVKISYTLDVKDATVQGRGLLVATDDGVVNITVSVTDAEASDEIATRILDTLQTGAGAH